MTESRTGPSAETRPCPGAPRVRPALLALALVRHSGAARSRSVSEVSEMKRALPFVLISIVLSVVTSRLAATGPLAKLQAKARELRASAASCAESQGIDRAQEGAFA